MGHKNYWLLLDDIINTTKENKSRDGSVAIALGYGLDDRGSKFRVPAGG
jgi:hypothetical protein